MDNIAFGTAFYSLRQPAWHALGVVSETEQGAVEASSHTITFDIEVQKLQVSGNGSIEVPLRGIFRTPIPEDPEYVFFGAVGLEYEAISPLKLFEIYDRTINAPVETMGALGRGETIFLTTKMPKPSVIAGDEVEHYLLIDAPMMGNQALYVRNVDLRVVCQNTLMIARSHSVQSYRIRHTQGAAEQLEAWMSDVYDRAVENSKLIDGFFQKMAQKSPTEEQLATVLYQTYPDPKPLVRNAPEDVMKTREASYEYNLEYQRKSRDLALDLFNGLGTGLDVPGVRGTFWALYNAIVELEDYRGSDRKGSTARQRDSLFGYRAEAKENAFSAILQEVE